MIQAANFNEQFISRNLYEFGKMLIAFREMNQGYKSQFILSLDGDEWIIFDARVGRDLAKFPFKHWKDIIEWCVSMSNDQCNAIWAFSGIKRQRNLKQRETWALKRLSQIYTPEEMEYFKVCCDSPLLF